MRDLPRARVRATEERRRSNAAGPHNTRPTRGAVQLAAVEAELADLDEEDDPEPVDLDAVVDDEPGRSLEYTRLPRQDQRTRAALAARNLAFEIALCAVTAVGITSVAIRAWL